MHQRLIHLAIAILVILTYFLYVRNLQSARYEKRKLDDTSRECVVYNKVAKCGSSSMDAVIKHVARYGPYRYNVFQDRPPGLNNFDKQQSREGVAIEASVIAGLPRPALYSRHVYYIDFTEFQLDKPIYINMVRDPVDRFVSNFYYEQFGSFNQNRSKPEYVKSINDCVLKQRPRCTSKYFLSLYITRHFCGHRCSYDERKAIEIAKRNIKKEYIFIGLVEEFDNSLLLLEKILPQFFLGAPDAWKDLGKETRHKYSTVHKSDISPEARKVLQEEMWADYEIYSFIKEKFHEAKVLHNVGL